MDFGFSSVTRKGQPSQHNWAISAQGTVLFLTYTSVTLCRPRMQDLKEHCDKQVKDHFITS